VRARRTPGPARWPRTAGTATAALLLAACAAAAPARRGPPPEQPGRPLVYVAVGASETVGFGATDQLSDAWPQVLFHTGLPRSATFINLGIPGETVAGALTEEVPQAVGLAPQLVTVWLNVNDALRRVSTAAYERDLGTLVGRLRRGGATAVLLADTPPLDRLPAYLACLPAATGPLPCRLPPGLAAPPAAVVRATTAAYSAAAARVAARTGAVLVPLSAAVLAARSAGTEKELYGADGFHPSTAGHRAVAAAFARALAGTSLP